MSLSDLHKYLAELIRDGAGGVAALVIGIALGGYAAWLLLRHRGRKALEQARLDNQHLQDETRRLQSDVLRLRERFARAKANVQLRWSDLRGRLRAAAERGRQAEAVAAKIRREYERLHAAGREVVRRLREQTRLNADLTASRDADLEELGQLRELLPPAFQKSPPTGHTIVSTQECPELSELLALDLQDLA